MSKWNIIILGKTGCGKSSFLNAIIKNFGTANDKLLKTSDGTDGCTADLEPVNIFYKNKHLCFYDSPGLDDGNENQNTQFINLLREEGKNPGDRINSILICINAQNPRFDAGLKNTIIEIMNCYPLNNFWNHVIIIKTHVTKDKYKKPGNIEQAIRKNEQVNNAMRERNIISPNEIKEFYFDSVNDDDDSVNTNDNIKNELEKLFKKIIETKPIYKNIRIIKEKNEDVDSYTITYQYLEYLDFKGKKLFKKIEINRKPKVIIKGKQGPYYSERKYGGEYKKCGKWYQDYIRYTYYIDEKNNVCDKRDYGEVIHRRV